MIGTYGYRGVDRRGVHIVGAQTTMTAAELTKQLFDLRYDQLSVSAPGGRVVGEIVRHPDTGKRIWWAES